VRQTDIGFRLIGGCARRFRPLGLGGTSAAEGGASMRVGDYIMDYLVRHKTDAVFTLPGGGAMHLIDALGLQSKLRAICCQHEQACGIAAEAWSRVTGRLGTALVTSGPGATNAVTPVAGAWVDSVPLLVISGQAKRADLKRDTGVRQLGVQEIDILSIVRPITKYAARIENPADVRTQLDTAFHLASTGRRGPVWLEVPLDVQAAPLPAELSPTPDFAPVPTIGKAALEQAAARTAALIAESERPVILAGQSIRLSGAAEIFDRLAAVLGVPVLTTWNAMDLLTYDNPLNAGSPGVVAMRGPNFTVQNCDLLLALGAKIDNVMMAYSPQTFARAARKIVVDVDPAELSKHKMPIELSVLADVGDFMAALLRQVEGQPRHDRCAWVSRCEGWKARYPAQDGKPFPEKGVIGHHHLAHVLDAALPEDCVIVTGSSGLAVETFYLGFKTKRGQRIFNTTCLGAMGYGLPALIGAAIGAPQRRVIGFESDGSLMLNVQELFTLKALGLPVILFIVNNAGYASIRTTQRNYFQGRFVGTGPESGLFLPEIRLLAQAAGIDSMRIEGVENLAPGIAEALGRPGPLLVEVVTAKDEPLWPRVAALPQPDGSIISMPMEDMTPLLPFEELAENMLVPLLPASNAARRRPAS